MAFTAKDTKDTKMTKIGLDRFFVSFVSFVVSAQVRDPNICPQAPGMGPIHPRSASA